MKLFARHKTVDEIRQQCEARGVDLDTRLLEESSSDFIRVSSDDGKTKCKVLFSTVNGRFFGTVSHGGPGMDFTSDDLHLDGTPWFDALLEFFYVKSDTDTAG